MSNLLEGDQLVNSLKQLVICFGPHMKEAGTYEQAEDTLLRLEEVDKNYHK